MTYFTKPFGNFRKICGKWHIVAAIVLFNAFLLSAQTPAELPNPNIGNPNNFVADPEGYLSESTIEHINHQISTMRKETTAEMGVAIIKTTGDMTPEDYAYELFKRWGIGKKDNNNGVLLLIAIDDHMGRIEVGSGAEGVMTDIASDKVLLHTLIPVIREGNINQAVSNSVDKIVEAFMDPAVRDELRSSQPEGAMDNVRAIDGKVILKFLFAIAICIFLFTLGMFILDWCQSRKRDNYRRAMTWYPHLPIYWLCAALSLGLALPIAFIAWRLYKRSRNIPEICDNCGCKMEKMPEDEDNAFLTASQDFEEKIGTVDYDVWRCPECGTVERFPYVERQLKYRKCPDCGTIAMNLVMDKVVEEPTTSREGHGERIYQCQFCRHKRREGYRIPRKTDGAALAAGAAIGMMSGRGGGFSGPSGGFGGGHSSGGGASRGW